MLVPSQRGRFLTVVLDRELTDTMATKGKGMANPCSEASVNIRMDDRSASAKNDRF